MKAGKRHPSLAGEGSVPRGDRHKFRLLAEHKKLVAKLIDGGPNATKTRAIWILRRPKRWHSARR